MRKIIFVLLVMISHVAHGQQDIFVLQHEKVVGKDLMEDVEIKGREYIFPERIHKAFFDSTNGFLSVQLRGLRNGKWLANKGKIMQYDLNNRELLWNKKIAYQTGSLQHFNNAIIQTVGNKTYLLDIHTGDRIWEVRNNIYHVDAAKNVGIGYRFGGSTGYTNDLEGIDMETGKLLWNRNLNREYGWNDVFYLNDSTLMVVSAGLHSININTGKGWDYDAITGKKDFSGMAATNAAGVALGLLTGTFLISTGHDVLRDLVSNALVDSAYIYLASKEHLVKIDKHTGEVAWQFPFLNDWGSKSNIFMDTGSIYVLNFGFAYVGNKQVDFGKPFLAVVDRQTGTQKSFAIIDIEKDPIIGYRLVENDLYIMFRNRISKYSTLTGGKIAERGFVENHFGNLEFFVGDHVFKTDESGRYTGLVKSDTNKIYVYTSKNKALPIDENLDVSDELDADNLSIYYLQAGNFKFLGKNGESWIIDPNGQKIAELEATTKAFLLGNTLYDTQDQNFLAIDLSKIIGTD